MWLLCVSLLLLVSAHCQPSPSQINVTSVWVTGFQTYNQPMTTAMPGSRYRSCGAVTPSNTFLHFGGTVNAPTAVNYGDLWEFDLVQLLWTLRRNSIVTVFGTKGNASALNWPGTLYDHKCVYSTSQRRFLMFGGRTNTNNLWSYDQVTLMWTYVFGNTTYNLGYAFGQQIADTSNIPAGRSKHVLIAHPTLPKLYIFGGYFNNGVTNAYRNDLWSYDFEISAWSWLSGNVDSTVQLYNNASVKGVFSQTNNPAARQYAMSTYLYTSGDSGSFFMYGGKGNSYFNDLWRFDLSLGQWALLSDPISNQATANFTGIFSSGNYPGVLNAGAIVSIVSAPGCLAIYGGNGYCFNNGTGTTYADCNDIWLVNTTTLQWALINSGDFASNAIQGVPFTGIVPSRRQQFVADIMQDGSLFVFGGFVTISAITKAYADMWSMNLVFPSIADVISTASSTSFLSSTQLQSSTSLTTTVSQKLPQITVKNTSNNAQDSTLTVAEMTLIMGAGSAGLIVAGTVIFVGTCFYRYRRQQQE